jgi:hypothetical protein
MSATLAIIVVLLAAFISLYLAVHHAADGYEDETGFHEGMLPRLASGQSISRRAVIEDWRFEGGYVENRPAGQAGRRENPAAV